MKKIFVISALLMSFNSFAVTCYVAAKVKCDSAWFIGTGRITGASSNHCLDWSDADARLAFSSYVNSEFYEATYDFCRNGKVSASKVVVYTPDSRSEANRRVSKMRTECNRSNARACINVSGFDLGNWE